MNDDSVPNCIDRYQLLEEIGRGGMGVVYSAYDPRLARKVALKRIAYGQHPPERMLREAQSMARLSHPNVVQVHDAGVADGSVFIAMELVEGSTLKEWLGQGATWRTAAEAFIAAGRGLAAAHQAGTVHRDFKPSNVLVSRTGRVLVSDFGLAKSLAGSEAEDQSEGTLTLTGVGQGTPRYMAPEQHYSPSIDARVDQYSFCMALAEAMQAFTPPPSLQTVIDRGLSANPAGRFASMLDLVEGLECAYTPSRRSWLRPIAVISASLAAMAAALVLFAEPHVAASPATEPREPSLAHEIPEPTQTSPALSLPAPDAPLLAPLGVVEAEQIAPASPTEEASQDLPKRRRLQRKTHRKPMSGRPAHPDALIRDLWKAD